MKATLNRCVFRRDLKFPRDDEFLIFAGNLSHKLGAATLNAQSPYDLSRDTGTCNSIWLDDLSFQDDFLIDTSSHRYSGAISLIDLIDLKWIHCLTCSQCSFMKNWSSFRVFVTMRAGLFWMLYSDVPYNRELQ